MLAKETINDYIKRCRNGDVIAQKKVYEHAYINCFEYTKKYSLDLDVRTTIFNNAMLEIFKHIYENKQIILLEGLVINMIKWRGLDFMRSKYKEAIFVELNDQHSDMQIVHSNYDEVLEDEKVHSLLTQLPEKEREVFVLAELDDMSHKEISDVLQISVSYSKWLLYNAKKILKGIIENSGSTKKIVL